MNVSGELRLGRRGYTYQFHEQRSNDLNEFVVVLGNDVDIGGPEERGPDERLTAIE
jgi:hypothetical protein